MLLKPVACQAQAFDKTFVRNFPDTINARWLVVRKGLHLDLAQRGQHYRLLPDKRTYLGVGGFFWNIGFSLLVPVSSPPLSGFLQSPVKRFDFQGSVYSKYWLLDVVYQHNRGYEVSPASHYLSAPETTATVSWLPDLEVRHVRVGAARVFNGEQIAMRSSFTQGSRQRKSIASWLLSGGLSFFDVHGSPVIFPTDLLPPTSPQQVRSRSLELQPGFAANLVHRYWTVNVTGLAGPSLQHRYVEKTSVEKSWAVEPVLDARMAVGYDNGRYFFGIWGVAHYMQSVASPETKLTYINQNVRLYIGFRFAEPDWLRKLEPEILDRLEGK